MENDLIDENTENQSPDTLTMNLIRWWERLRLPYNLYVILLQVLLIYFFLDRTSFEARHPEQLVLFSLMCLFLLNLCFCLGWGLPLLSYHYFKFKPISKIYRMIFLVVGCVLTFFLTVFVYALIL